MENIENVVANQRAYYLSGITKDLNFRIKNLKKIKELLYKYKDKFKEAFILDFNKHEFDFLSTEFLLIIDEIDYMLRHINKLVKPIKKRASILSMKSSGYLLAEPYGVVLVMAPWNYPLQLSILPLVGALAAGNTVILKPASYTKNVSDVIFEMFNEFANPNLVHVVLGGREQNQALLEQHFDYIFFTGGETVGKLVLEKASKYLTPVSLELGGKSPCIVFKDADIDLSAKRITWAKYLNAGQTCVAPDYICVHKDIHDEFIRCVNKYIDQFYYDSGKIKETFPYLINDKHKAKVMSLIDYEKVIRGGLFEDRLLHPTIIDNADFDSKCMSEEIFGPIMPIIVYDDLNKLLDIIKQRNKPLACYYFSKDIKHAKKVMDYLSFGGGCINDCIMHLTNHNLPFGGVGNSGMGSYHGKKSFETFSHYKSILNKGKFELAMKYPNKEKEKRNLKLLKIFAHIKD